MKLEVFKNKPPPVVASATKEYTKLTKYKHQIILK